MFNLIVAIGDVNGKSTADIAPQAEPTFQSLYQKSWAALLDCLAVPNLSTVQILLLHVSEKLILMSVFFSDTSQVIFHLQCSKAGLAGVLCGLAIRVAQAIGLHRRSPEDLDMSDEDVRLRSQLWWVAYRLDRSVIMFWT